MSYIKIMVHCVWGTHNHQKILIPGVREKLFEHIRDNARLKNIHIDYINGYDDHIHCLISLGADQNIAKLMQLIKGEASYWANREKLLRYKLEWAEDYFAASVSESSLNKARDYIKSQEEHHRKITYKEEYDKFIKSYGFKLG
jgi:putative transposase